MLYAVLLHSTELELLKSPIIAYSVNGDPNKYTGWWRHTFLRLTFTNQPTNQSFLGRVAVLADRFLSEHYNTCMYMYIPSLAERTKNHVGIQHRFFHCFGSGTVIQKSIINAS